MTERPIIMRDWEVRAILDERKTQTRRTAKPKTAPWTAHHGEGGGSVSDWRPELLEDGRWYWVSAFCGPELFGPSPFGVTGDRLWAKETWGWNGCMCCGIHYRATEPEWRDETPYAEWKPASTMRRDMSRITLEVTRVWVERVQASEKAPQTSGTCGQRGSRSSRPVAQMPSWVSRLKEQFDSVGSMEYSQTWKLKTTPAGRQYWAHTASARRTSGKGCTGWPTPMAGSPATETYNAAGNNDSSRKTTWLAGWNTPRATDGTKNQRTEHGIQNELKRKGHIDELPSQASLAGWPTTTVNDSRGGRNRTENRSNPDSKHRDGVTLVDVAGWATPMKSITTRSKEFRKGRSPNPIEAGIITPSSSAETEKPAASRLVLNPYFSAWLQGFPVEWTIAGERASLSVKRSRGGTRCSKGTGTR